jgi:hypothetical protein
MPQYQEILELVALVDLLVMVAAAATADLGIRELRRSSSPPVMEGFSGTRWWHQPRRGPGALETLSPRQHHPALRPVAQVASEIPNRGVVVVVVDLPARSAQGSPAAVVEELGDNGVLAVLDLLADHPQPAL